MPVPTVPEIKQLIETDIDTNAIQVLIDDAEQEVISRFGAELTQTDDLRGGEELLFPTRPISSVTTVTESVGNTDTVLSANDYRSKNGGRMLQRRTDGTNGRTVWADVVKLVYVPVNDESRRKRVIIDLVRLALKYNALASESVGDYSASTFGQRYQDEREQVLSTLTTRSRMIA